MNEKIAELRRLISEATTALRAMLDKAEGENRGLNEEEKTAYEKKKEEISGLQERLARAEEAAALPTFDEPAEPAEPPAPEGRGQGNGEQRVSVVPEQRTVWDRQQSCYITRNREDDEPFDNMGQFLSDVRTHALTGSVSARLSKLQTESRAIQGMSEIIPSDGGFVVQKDFSAEILRRVYETGAITSRVRFIPIGANSNGLKINAIAETSRAAGSRLGGVRTYWVGEGGDPTSAKPQLRQLELNLRKLVGLWYTTEELEADGTAMGAIAMDAFADELNFEVEQAFFEGDGVGKPKGALTSAAAVTVSKELGQDAATVVYENVSKMWARCWARSRRTAAWFIDQSVEPQLQSMSLTVGTGGIPVYMPAGGVSGTPYATLFGRPVIPVEYASAVGTKNDISLIDFSQYLAIDKGAPSTASSMHVRFLTGENTFRMMYRVDGQLTWDSALTPNSAGDTLSPVVNLAARS